MKIRCTTLSGWRNRSTKTKVWEHGIMPMPFQALKLTTLKAWLWATVKNSLSLATGNWQKMTLSSAIALLTFRTRTKEWSETAKKLRCSRCYIHPTTPKKFSSFTGAIPQTIVAKKRCSAWSLIFREEIKASNMKEFTRLMNSAFSHNSLTS